MQLDYFLSGTMQEPIHMSIYIYIQYVLVRFQSILKCVSILAQFPCSLCSVGCAGGAGAVKARCGWLALNLTASQCNIRHARGKTQLKVR